jgi:transposase InsO family protein
VEELALFQERNGKQAALCYACHAHRCGLVVAMVRWAAGIGCGTTQDLHPLASTRIWSVVAVDISSGTPPTPLNLQMLIRQMAQAHPTWDEERMGNGLRLQLGRRVSPETVRQYMPKHVHHGRGPCATSQRWWTFVRQHAQVSIACDVCVVITATLRLLGVFIGLEHDTRRILHVNVAGPPTAHWTMQHLRAAIPADHGSRCLIHDRDRIFAHQLEQHVQNLGLQVLTTPVRRPQANALGERRIGTRRWECLDLLIPLTGNHLRGILHDWVSHDKRGRPHMALGPGIPQPPPSLSVRLQAHRHRVPPHVPRVARPILRGFHHNYRLEEQAA